MRDRPSVRHVAACDGLDMRAPQPKLAAMGSTTVGEAKTGATRATFEALAEIVAGDLTHPRMMELVTLAGSTTCTRELGELVRGALSSRALLEPERVLELAEALAALGMLEEAYTVADHAQAASERRLASRRADWAMQLGRYEAAIAAADVAITGLLHAGLSVEDFLRLSARGAPSEGLLRYARGAVARLRHLHEPLAIRWEAMRRLGRKGEANLMRLACLRHFPDRASVWAAAGNQALDEEDPSQAERYFDRCLQLDSSWTAALAGKAIVYEWRKDWDRALVYRERVVVAERALERADPPSLQRAIRYGAALGRSGRWTEAGVVLRRCVLLGAYERLPRERPVLLRVFSRELYSPMLVAACLASPAGAPREVDESVRLAMHEVTVLTRLASLIEAAVSLSAHDAGLLLGICAWLGGHHEQAYALLDELERDDDPDLFIQYLLLCSADTIGAPELKSIASFAAQSARDAVASARANTENGDDARFYALAILWRVDGEVPVAAELSAGVGALALYRNALATADGTCPELTGASGPFDIQLRRIVTFRVAQQMARRSRLAAAAASAQALSALAQLTTLE